MIQVRPVCDGCGMAGEPILISQFESLWKEQFEEQLESDFWKARQFGAEKFLICKLCWFEPQEVLLSRRIRAFPDERISKHSTPSGTGNWGGDLRQPIRWSWNIEERVK